MRGKGNPAARRSVKASVTLADLKKKPIVSMADGAKIGEVDDLVIDTSRWAVVELYVAGKPGRGLLPLANLKGIGPDAITIEHADAISYNVKPAGVGFDSFKDLHVVDGTGTVRGNVSDLRFAADGTIESFDVRQGGVFGLGAHHIALTPANIRGVGDKIITVDLPA